MTMPIMFFTWAGILAPLYFKMLTRKKFYRSPLGTILSAICVSGMAGAITNSIAWRVYEGPMVE